MNCYNKKTRQRKQEAIDQRQKEKFDAWFNSLSELEQKEYLERQEEKARKARENLAGMVQAIEDCGIGMHRYHR